MSLVKPFRILEDETDVGPPLADGRRQQTWRIWQRVGRTGKSGYTCLEWMRFGNPSAAEAFLEHHKLPSCRTLGLWVR